jgi:hypothetical protein
MARALVVKDVERAGPLDEWVRRLSDKQPKLPGLNLDLRRQAECGRGNCLRLCANEDMPVAWISDDDPSRAKSIRPAGAGALLRCAVGLDGTQLDSMSSVTYPHTR